MKIINMYDQYSDIRCRGKNVFKTMRTFLAKYPEEYSECYYYNLDYLKLFKVDKMVDEAMAGEYDTSANVIFFKDNEALGHEFFHMASNNIVDGQYAIESNIGIEYGLIEGMTEYLYNKAYGLPNPTAYSFEVFVVKMLEDIPRLFEPYFIPNHDNFISLFPNEKDIYSLLYSLNVYSDAYYEYIASSYSTDNKSVDLGKIIENIEDTIDNLISIELSMHGNSIAKLSIYGDKFMDLIGSDNLKNKFKDVYPNYIKYAEKQIKRRIRER